MPRDTEARVVSGMGDSLKDGSVIMYVISLIDYGQIQRVEVSCSSRL